MLKPRYMMVGGFLGAGKTTAILKLAELLQQRGETVGLITNDQSVGLVDTAMLGSRGFDTEEITGGCFCCKFQSLVEAAETLRGRAQPTMFLAEPVGSCTDLRATVAYPLAQMYGDQYTIAPLSVLVDPIRAQRILGLKPGKSFSPKVHYVYEKQLEEAEVLVVNKTDLITADECAALVDALQARWPRARVLTVAAREGKGIEQWLETILQAAVERGSSMDVDYDTYAEGEALLGWLNLQAQVSGPESDGNAWLLGLAETLHRHLQGTGAEIAHLKMTLAPEIGHDLAVVNQVQGERRAELSHRLAAPLDAGQLLLNLRAETDPEVLREAVLTSLQHTTATTTLSVTVESVEAFRPGRPVPTHRLAN